MKVKFQIPRKTNLGYFSLATLRKADYIEWDDKFGRSYALPKTGYDIEQAREMDVMTNLKEGVVDIGIVRQSYFAENMGVWPEAGTEVDNLTVVSLVEYCPSLIYPLASKNSLHSSRTVIVQPTLEKTVRLLYNEFVDFDTKLMYSVHSGLNLGAGVVGFGNVSPLAEDEFKGDVGEDGWPYTRLKALDIESIGKINLASSEISLPHYSNYPVLVRRTNRNPFIDHMTNDFLTASRLIYDNVEVFDFIKDGEKYVSVPIKIRSKNQNVMTQIQNDYTRNSVVYREGKSRVYSIGSIVVLNYKIENMAGLELGLPDGVVKTRNISSPSSLSREIGNAAKNDAEFVVIRGQEEEANGIVTLRDMKNRTQERYKPEKLLEIIETPKKHKKILLVQEPGVRGYERRLNEPGENHASKISYLEKVYTSYRDMIDLITGGWATECVIGYNNLLEYLTGRYEFEHIPEIGEFNSYAKRIGIPLELERIGGSKCDFCLILPEDLGEKAFDDKVVTEFPNITSVALRTRGYTPAIRNVHGAAEIYDYPLADLVVSGETLKRNRKTLYAKIFESDAIVVRSCP